MGPRATLGSSPIRHTSDMGINRRLDFEQEESGLQETPALSGSGQRRGQRRSVYSIERSPSRTGSAVMEESIQQELIAAEDPSVLNHIAEESDLPDMPDDIPMSEEARAGVEASVDDPDSEAISEPTKHPAKRGRKRKNNAIEPVAEEKVRKPRKRGPVQTSSAEAQKESKKNPATANAPPRRSKRLSDVTDHGTSKVQGQPGPASRRIGTPPAVPRPRGRPPKIKPGSGESDNSSAKEQVDEAVFKKPKTATKPKKKANATMSNEERGSEARLDGKLVDVLGNPLSSADIDQMSTISGGSRLGRGRGLSVFRELDPDAPEVERSRFGRHRVAPINFWFNDRIEYDHQGEMQNIVKKQNLDPPPKKNKTGRSKGKKSRLSAIAEDDEVPLEQWEQDDGVFIGAYRGYDRDTEQTTNEVYEESMKLPILSDSITLTITAIAWAKKGIIPADVQSKAFKFTKLFADDNGLSFGRIDLEVDQEKRQKNTRRAHMVFHVTDGVVEAKVHENVLTVRRNGVFRVPQGKLYSIFSKIIIKVFTQLRSTRVMAAVDASTPFLFNNRCVPGQSLRFNL